jgi:hypothetical protein
MVLGAKSPNNLLNEFFMSSKYQEGNNTTVDQLFEFFDGYILLDGKFLTSCKPKTMVVKCQMSATKRRG